MYSDYKTSKFPGYFMWIDGLRGIAAVFVVIFHYHHFYLADADARLAIPDPATFPYAQLLQPVFVYGSHAVELFWVISGFVFTHVYLDAPTSLRGFAVARFARLYPLHFLTLCYVALLQILSFNLAGHWQVYGHNDLRHFVLQLFLSSNWNTLGLGLSFNGPIWSVSLETVIYAVFFVSLTALRRLKSVTAVSLCVLFWIAVFQWPTNFQFLSSGIAECGG